jgi:hypothetical protein
MLYAMAWLFEHWDGRVAEIVRGLPASHPSVALLLVLAVGVAIRVAFFNSSAGFRAVYGNSARLASFVQLAPVVPAVLFLYVYTHVWTRH